MIELDVAPIQAPSLSAEETLRAKIKSGKWTSFHEVIPDAQETIDWDKGDNLLDKSPKANDHVLSNCKIFIKDILEGTTIEAAFPIMQLFQRQLFRTSMKNDMPIPFSHTVLQEVLTQFIGPEEFEVTIEYQGAGDVS